MYTSSNAILIIINTKIHAFHTQPSKLNISTSTLVSSPRPSASKSPSRNSSPHHTPTKTGLSFHAPAKKSSQKLGVRLKNLLKLPKAYKWCIYEWFYSNIDK